ncbi:hypothetical protein EBU95_18780 [bacterium]|nr:hypothetical protein [bacterium]
MLTELKNYTHICNLAEEETEHLLLAFCTYCSLLAGKKLSFQNVFLNVLRDQKYREILKELTDIETDYEIIKLFIDYDNTIIKSKYVTRHINNLNRSKSL